MPNTVDAADSYTNAKDFFDSTGLTNGKHIECYNGMVYFATKAKAATSSTALKYTSIGFDVTLTGGGYSLTFAVKRGVSLTELKDANVSGTHNYRLYCITTEDLHALASKVNKKAADAIFTTDQFKVRMDAIMTTKQNGVDHGAIKENGDGTITVVSNPVYHLNRPEDLAALKKKFNNDFESFQNIEANLVNYKNTIYYSVGDGVTMASGYSAKPYTLSGTTINNVLYSGNNVYAKGYKTLQRFYLLDTGANGLNLKKTGHHLGDNNGGAVWKKSDGKTYSITQTYGPKDLHDNAGLNDTMTFLYANWIPNTYKIHYDLNGGSGSLSPSTYTYNVEGTLRYLQSNTIKRTGYYLVDSAMWIDANGKTYPNGARVYNWTTKHEDVITLKLNWQRNVAEITLDKQGGSTGTNSYFQQYGVGFFSTAACTTPLDKITAPTYAGKKFMGYFTSYDGMGAQVISSTGNYLKDNMFFKNSTTIYAHWQPETYTVTFDKQGGTGGTDSVTVGYNEAYPAANAPNKENYKFMGYYTGTNGTGTQVYNEFMSSPYKYTATTNTILYAYWKDEVPPTIELTVSNPNWTNQRVTLTAEARDYGTGLDNIIIYRINADGSTTAVASATGLNGATKKELSFVNTTEGIVRYKAVATDRSQNVTETVNVVYYDTKAPTGTVVNQQVTGDSFSFEIDITDINTGN